MGTVRLYLAGWGVFFVAIPLVVVVGSVAGVAAVGIPFIAPAAVWLVVAYRVIARPEEWPAMVRYWGWLMRPRRGIDINAVSTRWWFGLGHVFLAGVLLFLVVASVLELLDIYTFE